MILMGKWSFSGPQSQFFIFFIKGFFFHNKVSVKRGPFCIIMRGHTGPATGHGGPKI